MNVNDPFIIPKKNFILFDRRLLVVDAEEILFWVGFGWSPKDNDDERVKETRDLMERRYKGFPYGMNVGNPDADGLLTKPLTLQAFLSDEKDTYRLEVSSWPKGTTYRLNLHTLEGNASSNGSQIDSGRRDGNVSWANLERRVGTQDEAFLHREANGAGYSIRILILPDGNIVPMGDSAHMRFGAEASIRLGFGCK